MPPAKRRKWLRRIGKAFLASILLLVAFLVWLNGPGIRWLGPRFAGRFLKGSGIEGTFALDGSVIGGLRVRELKIGGGLIPGEITAAEIAPVYQFKKALRGEVGGIVINGLHAKIDLALQKPKKDEPQKPFDPQTFADQLRAGRARFLPMLIQLTNIRVDVKRGAEPVVSIAPSDIIHKPGEETISLKLGQTTDRTGKIWPAQQTVIRWQADELSLDRIDLLPEAGVRDLSLKFPVGAEPSADAKLLLDDAVFEAGLAPGFRDVRLDLREGRVTSGKLFGRLGITPPLRGEISSLAVNLEQVMPEPKFVRGEVRLLVENFEAGGWEVPELNLDAKLGENTLELIAKGRALDTPVDIHAAAPLERGEFFRIGNIAGDLLFHDARAGLRALAEKHVPALDAKAYIPRATLGGKFSLEMAENKPGQIRADLSLKPEDITLASPLQVVAAWQPQAPLDGRIVADGLDATVHFPADFRAYEGEVALADFSLARIARWLEYAKVKTPGKLVATGNLTAGGNFAAQEHRGNLDLRSLVFQKPESAEIAVNGKVDYQWPGEVKVAGLKLAAGPQVVETDAVMAGGFLEIPRLSLHENGVKLLDGTVRLPVPEDFAKWREMLAEDLRPLAVSLESQTLGLARFSHWAPQLAKLEPDATGKIRLQISGTYEQPDIDGLIELKDIRQRDQAKIPPADLKVSLKSKDRKLAVNGELLTPGYAPAVFRADTAFAPAAWARDSELLKREKINARLELPRVDVSRFAPLVPAVKKLSGVVNGFATVTGEIGKPDVRGTISLAGGEVAVDPAVYPPLSGIGAQVDFAMDRVVLRNLNATAAGGTLKATGTVSISAGKPGPVELRVVCDHMPLKRDHSVIVRANTNLTLAGPVESPMLAGTVEIVDSLFFRDIELIPVGVPLVGPSAAALPKLDAPQSKTDKIPAPFKDWKLAVTVRTPRPFLIRGNLGTGEVMANLKVGGTLGDPRPVGEAKITEATAALPFSKLRVRNGIIRFTGSGLDPVLEIRGTAEPRPYRVYAYVYGNASDPQLVLTSSPPLPQNEIMTLLATGSTTSGLEDSKMATSRALQLLAEEVRRGRVGVAKPLRPLLSTLDRVDFTLADEDPYTSTKFSSANLSLTEKWVLSAGMSEEGETRVMGIWRMNFR